MTALPEPTLNRFQPLRSGLINLYKYEDQQFCFERGRLLLRGDNGTGKSRVLALQLPFLFDGEISPHRVEPDQDSAKALAWNLLMNQYDDRVGYTWIEFGRKPQDSPAVFVTLGCGMRAIKGVNGLPNRWYFVTEKRVGLDFHLVTERQQPLSRDQLTIVLGENALYRTPHEYRKEVDARLFGLNERYDSLIELLIRLRAPQLARKLDEERLSGALSDALPPISDALINDVAESFSNLDSLRADLNEHRQMHEEVGDFLQDYRRYLQVSARRRADTVRSQHSHYEETNRKIANKKRDQEAAALKILDAESSKRSAELEQQSASSRIDALRDSPFQEAALALESAYQHCELCKQQLAQGAEDLKIRNDQARNAAENLGKLESQRDQRSNELTSLVSEMKTAAAQASFLEEHNRYLSKITASPQTQEWMLQTKQAFEKRADRHREAISRLMQLQQECIARQQEMQQAQEKETEAEQKVAAEREAERQIEQELLSFAEQVLADYVKWGSTLVWLRAEDSSVLAEAMAKWLETGLAADWTLPSILERAVKHAEGDRRSELAQVEKKIEDIEQKIVALKSEQNDLEMGKHVPPFAPKTRDLDVREQIKGAPLWRVCDFRDHLDHVAQAGLEAALESAGLLDALITQEGAIHFPEAYDTFLAGAEIVVPKDSLGLWLSPSLSVNGSQLLTAASIEKALQHVGAGAGNGNHWVNTDGEWQLGPVRGRGRKEAAEHLGQAAREAARRRRISEIQEELALQDVELQKAKNIQEQLNTTRVRAIAEERDRAPTDEHIVMGLVRRSTTRERLVEARRNYETCQSIKAEAQKNLQNALEKRERESVDLQLAQWQEKPELLHDRWQNYRLLLGGLWPTARLRDDACKQVESASASLEQCREEAFIAKQRFADAESKWTEAYSRYNTLNENTGASVAELHSQTKAAKNKLEKAHKQFNEATEALIQAKGEQVAAQQQVQQLNDEITTIMNERVAAIDKLQLLAKHNLFPDAHSTFGVFEAEPWSVTRAIEIAREVEKTLRDTRSDDEAWRHQQTILFQRFTELQTALGTHGHQPQMEYADDSLVAISCPFHGQPLRLSHLQAALADEIAVQERLLTEKEREAIDNHLMGEVATTLQTLIRDAEAKVNDMNEEITRCSTSTGLTMRLKWEERAEGAPEGLREARRLLLAESELWSPEERKQLAEFLHGLIKDARAANPSGIWYEHLRQALDYRVWHNFAVESRQNGKWERLTRRRYGTGSGGEKALMLTVPQMAAAAAHYRSAAPYSPRLILLDEVFVGIDSKVRAKCMGLLEAFDLDFVMTSEREWGAYPTISGLAIYQLTTRPGIDAIATTRWVWNGQQRTRTNQPTLEFKPNANGRRNVDESGPDPGII